MRNSKLFVTAASGDSGAPLISGVAVSSTTTYYSKMFSGGNAENASIRLEWTGTPTGTLTLWYSDKQNPNEASDADWDQDTTWTATNPAGSAAHFHTDLVDKPALRKRFKYVNASGSGVLSGNVTVHNY